MNTEKTIELLKKHDLLRIIEEPLDIYLEIPHIAYIEVKKPDSKALLFTNPIDKKNNKTFDTPVLMNIFCSQKAVELLIGDANKIANEIEPSITCLVFLLDIDCSFAACQSSTL